jgi:glucose/arabinose dehydrogenase
LLDVVLSPDFRQDRLVYLSYAEGGGAGDKAGTAVGRGRLSDDLKTIKDFKVIFRQEPKLSTGNHFGSRLVFDRDGYLFITLGENNDRPTAQDLDKLQGKVVRIFPTARCRTTIRSWASPACVRKSGPTATATRRARRSIRGRHTLGNEHGPRAAMR